MVSKIIFVLLIVFLPLIVFAIEQDYLFVSLSYDFSTNKVTILSIDQRVLDSSQVLISNSGNFELFLIDGNKVVSRNTFTMPIKEEVEVILKDGSGVYTKPNSYSTTVVLPLERSIDVEDLSFQVKKDGQVIFSENFSADTFTILEVKENTIKTPEPPIPGEKSIFSNYLFWLIAGLLVFLIWFVWRWRMIREKASESENIMR